MNAPAWPLRIGPTCWPCKLPMVKRVRSSSGGNWCPTGGLASVATAALTFPQIFFHRLRVFFSAPFPLTPQLLRGAQRPAPQPTGPAPARVQPARFDPMLASANPAHQPNHDQPQRTPGPRSHQQVTPTVPAAVPAADPDAMVGRTPRPPFVVAPKVRTAGGRLNRSSPALSGGAFFLSCRETHENRLETPQQQTPRQPQQDPSQWCQQHRLSSETHETRSKTP